MEKFHGMEHFVKVTKITISVYLYVSYSFITLENKQYSGYDIFYESQFNKGGSGVVYNNRDS